MSFLTYIFADVVLYCTRLFMQAKTESNTESETKSVNAQRTNELEDKKCALEHLAKDTKTRFANTSDYYTVLGVTKNSTPEEIKLAFELVLQTYNFDTIMNLIGNGPNHDAAAKWLINVIHNAYKTLGNATNKYYYDNKNTINNTSDPDELINMLIDGFVDDHDPNDPTAYWHKSELNNRTRYNKP